MKKILCLLHLPPPDYGVTLLNKSIIEGKIRSNFILDAISINTTKCPTNIERVTIEKFFIFIRIFFSLLARVFTNRYSFCYFSLTPTGIGFYKDMMFVMLLKIFCIRRLYHLHGKGISQKRRRIDKLLYRLCFQGSKVIHLAGSLYYDIEQYVDKKNLFIVPNAIEHNLQNDQFESVVRERSNKNVLNLLFLSNLIRSKGVFTCLESAGILHKKNYNFKFYFAGEFYDITKNEFQDYIKKLDIDEKIEYVGFKSGKDKHRMLERADIFVYPTHKDTFPLVLLEAMQYGLPVISTNEGAIPEIVENGTSGFIIPSKDPIALAQKIEVLLNDHSLRNIMGRQGHENFLRAYTFDLFEERLGKVFEELSAD